MRKGPLSRSRKGSRREVKHLLPAIVLVSALSSCMATTDSAEDGSIPAADEAGWPAGDPQIGKTLFVNKGCVICHSVKGVGGRAALPLDAPPDGRKVDPMVFAAAMWEGASAMISLQFTELGYQIGMTGEELRDLTAFASDLETQSTFSLDDIPADLRAWIIDLPHWQGDDWPEPFESLPDGTPSPFEDL
ncbi:MAG: hypothetical protein ACR2RA_03455 [Geminicoccaceae bacterium]